MDENASIETIRPNSPLFDTGRVTFNDSVEMIQAQEAVEDHEDQNLKKENCYTTKNHENYFKNPVNIRVCFVETSIFHPSQFQILFENCELHRTYLAESRIRDGKHWILYP